MISLSIAEYKRLFHYSLIGSGTFLFDLLLLYISIDILGWNYLVATGSAFLVAVSINYTLSRRFVFSNTSRGFLSGYVYFLLIVSSGLVFITGAMYVAVDIIGLNYLLSRIGIAGITGLWNYLMNLLFNFKLTLHTNNDTSSSDSITGEVI